ncbi:MAG: ribosome biogenesis GTPase Der [Pseudomonadota bacterium]
MLPVVAIVGRPNVGKSTLFNRLTRTRDALVADYPGLTRDRQYGFGRVGPVPYLVVDTGGLSGDAEGVDALMAAQVERAIDEADVALFIVDARDGLSSSDTDIAAWLRRRGIAVRLVVNKAEGLDADLVGSEFYALGVGEPAVVSAAHGDRVAALMEAVLTPFEAATEPTEQTSAGITICVAGRPNVGKSTLINRIVGEERVVAFDQPGTTRDSITVPFERDGEPYTLIDTAGVRRRSRVSEAIEKFSIVKALQAIDRADVVISVLDAQEGITEQDVSLLGLVVERGRALVVAINKWDGLDNEQRRAVRDAIDRRMPFLDFARKHYISALHGSGVGDLFGDVRRAYRAATVDLPASKLTGALEAALEAHPPPLVRRRRIRLRYAHQGGRNPPVIVIHGSQTDRIPDSYRRYLINYFRKVFRLSGTPIRLKFRTGENPFAGRRNTLTPRQQRKRDRLMKKVRK